MGHLPKPQKIHFFEIKSTGQKYWTYARLWHLPGSHTRVHARSAMSRQTTYLSRSPVPTDNSPQQEAERPSGASAKLGRGAPFLCNATAHRRSMGPIPCTVPSCKTSVAVPTPRGCYYLSSIFAKVYTNLLR